MTCPILKRPADCTRPGPSRLSFTPKPRPKQCVGELEIPGLPSTARTLFSGLRVSTHGKQAGPLVGFYHSAGRQPANSTPPSGWGVTEINHIVSDRQTIVKARCHPQFFYVTKLSHLLVAQVVVFLHVTQALCVANLHMNYIAPCSSKATQSYVFLFLQSKKE